MQSSTGPKIWGLWVTLTHNTRFGSSNPKDVYSQQYRNTVVVFNIIVHQTPLKHKQYCDAQSL